jgi:hypothetical protein
MMRISRLVGIVKPIDEQRMYEWIVFGSDVSVDERIRVAHN